MSTVVYIDSYAEDEAVALAKSGVTVLRVAKDAIETIAGQVTRGIELFMRGPKFKPPEYIDMAERLESLGFSVTTTGENYRSLSDSGIYEATISEFAPPKMICEAGDSKRAQQGLMALKEWGTVFIRTELGSAAKFNGIDACMIHKFSGEEISEKLGALAAAFPKAERIIARRVETVRKIDGKNVEGRFVVLKGRIAHLDHCEVPGDIHFEGFFERNVGHAKSVSQAFSAAGISGDYFLDIAEKEAGGWFVVEVKPAFNGTLRNIDEFVRSLLTN